MAGIFTLKLMPGSDISYCFECFHANFFISKACPRKANNSLNPDEEYLRKYKAKVEGNPRTSQYFTMICPRKLFNLSVCFSVSVHLSLFFL